MLLVNIDFFSSGKVTGWTNAIIIGSSSVTIKTACGLVKNITDSITVIRNDVNNKYNFDDDEATGFNLNLFDLFNDRINHFDIYVDNFKVWSSVTKLEQLEIGKSCQKKRVFEIGGRRLFVLYDKGSWLDEISGKLHYWNKNQFNKSLNNGIAISFMSIQDFQKNIKNIDLSKSENIFIIERAVVREAIILNRQVASYPLIIMEKNINLELDYNGVFSSVSYMSNFEDGIKVTASILRTIIDTLTSYCEIFFDISTGFLLFVSGPSSKAASEKIRSYNKEKQPFKGCLILSEKNIIRLTDFDKEKDTLFINSNLLRNTFDIMDSESDYFLNKCFKRGIKVKSLGTGEEL